MKLADEISRETLNIAFEVAVFAEKDGKPRDGAIDAAVCHVRGQGNLSMLEQMHLRSWLKNELEEKVPAPKRGSKPATPKPSFLHRMVGPDGAAVIHELSGYTKRIKGLVNRKTVLVLAAVLVVVTGLYPPWISTFSFEGTHSEKNAGYAFIFTPPVPESTGHDHGVRLDVSRLVIEWVCIIAATGAAWLVLVPYRARLPLPQAPGESVPKSKPTN